MKNIIIRIIALIAIVLYSCSTGEKYPTIKYEVVNQEFNSGDCDSVNFECVQIKISSLEFLENDGGVSDSIKSAVDDFILAPTTDTGKFNNLFELRDSLFKNYKRTRIELPDMKIGYYLQRDVIVETDTLGVLGLLLFESAFYGGAHPNSFTIYENFDLIDGRKIELDELLNPGFESELNTIAEINFRNLKNIEPDDSLEDAGYWFEENKFKLNRNFLITPAGLLFFFNAYEIAPYAWGPTELLIEYSQFKNLINRDGVLSRFAE